MPLTSLLKLCGPLRLKRQGIMLDLGEIDKLK